MKYGTKMAITFITTVIGIFVNLSFWNTEDGLFTIHFYILITIVVASLIFMSLLAKEEREKVEDI